MATTDKQVELWLFKYGYAVARKALEEAKARCGSKTLRKSMYIIGIRNGVGGQFHCVIHVPQYWAKMYHQGTNAKLGNKFLVVFRDPKKDPRIKRGYPVTKDDIKSFWDMPVAWRYWKKKYDEAVENHTTPPMIITRSMAGNKPHPFMPTGSDMKKDCDYHVKYDPETSIAKFIRSKMAMEGLNNRKRNVTRNV